jgi:uncharacterized protein
VRATLDVSRTTGGGYALRLRFEANLSGPCMRCLEPAAPLVAVDSREVSQPSEDLDSPYLDGGVLDLHSWADLNRAGPEHRHEQERDPRWAKLSEIRFE